MRKSITVIRCDVCGSEDGTAKKHLRTNIPLTFGQGGDSILSVDVSIAPQVAGCSNPDICGKCLGEHVVEITEYVNAMIGDFALSIGKYTQNP